MSSLTLMGVGRALASGVDPGGIGGSANQQFVVAGSSNPTVVMATSQARVAAVIDGFVQGA